MASAPTYSIAASKGMQCEKCEINGYEIPAKSKLIVNAWAVGRDPNHCGLKQKKFILKCLN